MLTAAKLTAVNVKKVCVAAIKIFFSHSVTSNYQNSLRTKEVIILATLNYRYSDFFPQIATYILTAQIIKPVIVALFTAVLFLVARTAITKIRNSDNSEIINQSFFFLFEPIKYQYQRHF